MSLLLEIPDQIAQAIRLPIIEQQPRLMTELALALYARGILSFGKARQLAECGHAEFSALLGRRGIPRHYTVQDAEDDIAYARG